MTVSDRLLTVGRGRDREGLMPAIAGRDRDLQGSNPVNNTTQRRGGTEGAGWRGWGKGF